jgi:DNA recombination protein Rad52
MPFSEEQKALLDAKLESKHVKTREQGKQTLSYIEAWHAIAEANRIFGFDGWTCETTNYECVDQHERKIGKEPNAYPGWGVTYICKVKVSIGGVIREGCGAGHGIDRDLGQAHESALKEAESDALKRALRSFGSVFGLALYDRSHANVTDDDADEIKRQEQEIKMREDYIKGCREHIEQFGHDWPKLAAWWQSPAQKEAHRKYLSDAEMEELKLLVLSKKPVEEIGRAAEQSEGT